VIFAPTTHHLLVIIYCSLEHSRHQNKLIFRTVARFLAHRNTLVVLRVPCALLDTSLSSDQYWVLVPPPGEPSAQPKSRTEESPWDYMQLLKLVDSDDLLAPRCHPLDYSARPASTASEVPSVPQVTPVKRTEGATDAHSTDTMESDDRAARLQDEEMMLDVEEYLQSSLESSLGPPDRYNPVMFSSGSINNMVSERHYIYRI